MHFQPLFDEADFNKFAIIKIIMLYCNKKVFFCVLMVNLSVFRPDAQKGLESEDYFESTFENYLNEMYKDTEIYITCEYSDGSKQTKTLKLYADCEIIGTKEEYFLVNDSTYADKNTHEKYEKYEVYDYTVKLCAKII